MPTPENEIQEPPPAPSKSPEQLQLEKIGEVIGVVRFVSEVVRNAKLSVHNIGQMHQAGEWLNGVHENLVKDFRDLQSKMPQGAPLQNKTSQEPPVA